MPALIWPRQVSLACAMSKKPCPNCRQRWRLKPSHLVRYWTWFQEQVRLSDPLSSLVCVKDLSQRTCQSYIAMAHGTCSTTSQVGMS